MRITILVGTMSGTSEMVAEEMGDALHGAGHEAEILVLDDASGPALFARDGVFVLCMSTYGSGNVPDNALALLETLEAARPDLSQVRYGVFALGDHTYQDTFCHGGETFDRLLASLGAQRIGAIRYNDASSSELPEDVGPEWVLEWVGTLAASGERVA